MRAWGLAVASVVVVTGTWFGMTGPDTSPVGEDAVVDAQVAEGRDGGGRR